VEYFVEAFPWEVGLAFVRVASSSVLEVASFEVEGLVAWQLVVIRVLAFVLVG